MDFCARFIGYTTRSEVKKLAAKHPKKEELVWYAFFRKCSKLAQWEDKHIDNCSICLERIKSFKNEIRMVETGDKI